jgi:NDP-sugar pyrophosphorylase family protein
VRAFRTTAEFMDIGTPADYLDTALLIAAREGHADHPGACAQVAAQARVERSILWDDVVVEPHARLKECVVTDGVRVPADTSWHGVTLRVPDGELAPGEKRIGDLAVCAL